MSELGRAETNLRPRRNEPPSRAALRRTAAVLLIASLACTGVRAQAQTAAARRTALADLAQRSGARLATSTSDLTGFATFVAAKKGYPISLPVAAAAPARARADAFLRLAAPAFGIADERQVAWRGEDGPDEVGMEHVRYEQTYQDVPVASAELVVHLQGGAVSSANGHALPGISVDTTPTIDAARARQLAAASVRKAGKAGPGYGAGGLSLSEPRLEVLNVGFFLRRGLSENHLAWFVEATATAVRERIWIDAHDGATLLQFSQLTDARNRLVYTANGGSSTPGTLVRSEGQGSSGDGDVDDAYDYSGDTYDYYAGEHGRDSYDDAGATLTSTTHWCDAGLCGSCPCRNAFWNGSQMIYGEGFSAADDVVAHELTHAVTENTAGLVYCLQSGALNESFSDIFGETVDLTNIGGTDNPSVRWLMGEDVPVFGALRNMSNPNAFGDPGKVSDSQFFCATSCADADYGGVHTNSGVPNHAYALMVDGGTYNGFTVTGVGLTKAGKIQYRALTQYLTANAQFLDDYDALNQSCQDLLGVAGISAADCAEVDEALKAAEMQLPVCAPAVCGNGVPEAGEQCDDGNLTDCDGCDSNCEPSGCGNGLTACGEQCDDGNVADGDGCESDCTLSPGCSLYTAADVPQNIPDLGSAVSSVNVPVSGVVFDVNVVNLSGTHTFVGDLEFHLASPAGTSAVVVDNVCGDADDFDLALDDEAASPIPCPPTDGAAHTPSFALSALDGFVPAGNWNLTVLDQAGADIGTLDGWGLLLCLNPCGNGLPDAGEECDDGDFDDADGCTNSCTSCGNGATTPPEQCDDGDLDNGDGCDANCTPTGCGNGIVTAPEECDDGNANDFDLCRNDCTINPAVSCPGNPFANCSFEAGDLQGWEVQDLSVPLYPLSVGGSGNSSGFGFFLSAPTDGVAAALHGFDGNGPGTISLAQNVQLPGDAAALLFDYRAAWDLITYGGGSLSRTFQVAIQHPVSHADLHRETVLTASPGSAVLDTGDLLGAIDIAAYAGQMVRVSFEWSVPEYYAGPGFFQFDHVRVSDTAPPPTPTPTSTPTPTDTPSGGDCCFVHNPTSPSCSDTTCSGCVCGIDPFCCNVNWDSLCVQEANNECADSCTCEGPLPTPTPPADCAATPVAGCTEPGKAILSIKDKSPAGSSAGDKLIWKWLKGPALTTAAIGNPIAPTNGYRLCVYDDTGAVAAIAIPGGGQCGDDACWKPVSDKGFKFKDPDATNGGAAKLIAKGGDPGKSKILLKAGGINLLTPTLPLTLSSGVTVQLVRDDDGGCWQAVFPAAMKNDAGSFKAKQ